MATTVPITEPTRARVGDTWLWRREDLTDYPASSWTLKYYFRNASAHFDVTASADGDLFAVDVAKATTAAFTAGDYDWVAVVESATDRHEVDAGHLVVQPDYSAAANLDDRTFARTMLDAVEAAISAKATAQQLDLVRGALTDRSMEFDTAALIKLRNLFKIEVKREQAALDGYDRSRLLVRFG